MHTYVQGQLEQILSIVLDGDSPHPHLGYWDNPSGPRVSAVGNQQPRLSSVQTEFVDDYAGLYYLLANISIGDYHSPLCESY